MNPVSVTGQPPLDAIAAILTDIVKAVVRRPDAVKVTQSVHGPIAAFVIKTDQEDVRRVIGQKGKHFKAMSIIIDHMAKRHGFEGHLVVDEKGPPVLPPTIKAFSYSSYDPAKFETVRSLLFRIFQQFATDHSKLGVVMSEVGSTVVFQVNVAREDYQLVYGPEMMFEYGRDGAIIGSIKNLFDGIGKNHGRIIRIAATAT